MAAAADESVLNRLREILAAVVEMEAEQIPADASFYRELEMDSLEKIEMIARIERSFGVQFDPEEAAEVDALTDIEVILRNRVGEMASGVSNEPSRNVDLAEPQGGKGGQGLPHRP